MRKRQTSLFLSSDNLIYSLPRETIVYVEAHISGCQVCEGTDAVVCVYIYEFFICFAKYL